MSEFLEFLQTRSENRVLRYLREAEEIPQIRSRDLFLIDDFSFLNKFSSATFNQILESQENETVTTLLLYLFYLAKGRFSKALKNPPLLSKKREWLQKITSDFLEKSEVSKEILQKADDLHLRLPEPAGILTEYTENPVWKREIRKNSKNNATLVSLQDEIPFDFNDPLFLAVFENNLPEIGALISSASPAQLNNALWALNLQISKQQFSVPLKIAKTLIENGANPLVVTPVIASFYQNIYQNFDVEAEKNQVQMSPKEVYRKVMNLMSVLGNLPETIAISEDFFNQVKGKKPK